MGILSAFETKLDATVALDINQVSTLVKTLAAKRAFFVWAPTYILILISEILAEPFPVDVEKFL